MKVISLLSFIPLVLFIFLNLLTPNLAADCSTITEITTGILDRSCCIDSRGVSSSGFVADHGRLKLNSIQLVDASNSPIQLMGVSSHNILEFSSCYTFAALQHLVTNWGITCFRITVYLEGANGYLAKPSENDVAIAALASHCETLGIYAIIDYHVMEFGDPNHYLDYMGAPTGHAITFWQKYANLYKNKNHVLYEIANEPNNADWQPNIVAYLNSVIAKIREIDPVTIIIAGVPQWSQALYYPGNDGGVTNTFNVMYAFHFYAAAHMFLYSVVEQYSRTLPIFVTEWSPSSWTSVGVNLDNSDVFLQLFTGKNANNPISISSTVWTWADKAGEDVSLLTAGACASQNWGSLTCTGKYMKNYIHGYRVDQLTPSGPTVAPSTTPTRTPTATPTNSPTTTPSLLPSRTPTTTPSLLPSKTPTARPTVSPTVKNATNPPTRVPTKLPSRLPTVSPSVTPSKNPTVAPTPFVDTCVADPSLVVKVRKR